ncbi:formyl peptide receptor 2-like [Bufo gargarizans]|uniref:formyl peptide receptor 2-like n=1 Tax=Bufo gargarizans TaxID=30331 RepID=UPI001CF3A1BB|nr:formyl peptide receptor 2-like [Bufo gargarizans]
MCPMALVAMGNALALNPVFFTSSPPNPVTLLKTSPQIIDLHNLKHFLHSTIAQKKGSLCPAQILPPGSHLSRASTVQSHSRLQRFISYTGTGPALMMNGTICNSSNNDSCGDYNNNDISLDDPYDYYFVFLCFFFLLGTIGNGLVIWFCLFRMEKTVNVIWFLNLAIADFIFALFLAFIIVDLVFLNDGPLSDSTLITSFVIYLNMVVSVLQLAVISVDRCICVVFPVWCRNHRTRRLALIVVLVIWIFSISSQIIDFFVLDDNYDGSPIVRFLFLFLLPFIVIVSSYTILILRIKDKNIIKSSRPFKIIVAVVITFFIYWFPYYLFDLLDIILRTNINVYEAGIKMSSCLMYFNCCINPILYVFIGQDFKQKCCGSFQAVFEKAFREDMGQMNFMEN